MVKRRKHYSKRKTGIFSRLFRSALSIVVLSAFILGLSLFIKKLSTFNVDGVAYLTNSILIRLGISNEEAGKAAGMFAQRLLETDINPSISSSRPEKTGQEAIFSVALMADSHNDNAQLSHALHMASEKGITTVFFLGDATNYGVTESLQEVKNIFDNSNLTYYIQPGDHDLYKTVGSKNFVDIFGKVNKTVTIENIKFVVFDNSANFTKISDEDMQWFESEVANADFVMLAQPVFYPMISVTTPVMGIVNGEETPEIREQANEILDILQNSEVKTVFVADHHVSSISVDEKRPSLKHVVVGAIGAPRKLQSSRFSILEVREDGTYNILEVLL